MNAGPLTYVVGVDSIPPDGRRMVIEAGEAERRSLADALGVPEVATLKADLKLSRGAGDALHISGAVEAIVVQTDVVTLDPVRQGLSEPVDLTLLPAVGLAKIGGRVPATPDPIDSEGPEY
jgi:hypothetical protein